MSINPGCLFVAITCNYKAMGARFRIQAIGAKFTAKYDLIIIIQALDDHRNNGFDHAMSSLLSGLSVPISRHVVAAATLKPVVVAPRLIHLAFRRQRSRALSATSLQVVPAEAQGATPNDVDVDNRNYGDDQVLLLGRLLDQPKQHLADKLRREQQIQNLLDDVQRNHTLRSLLAALQPKQVEGLLRILLDMESRHHSKARRRHSDALTTSISAPSFGRTSVVMAALQALSTERHPQSLRISLLVDKLEDSQLTGDAVGLRTLRAIMLAYADGYVSDDPRRILRIVKLYTSAVCPSPDRADGSALWLTYRALMALLTCGNVSAAARVFDHLVQSRLIALPEYQLHARSTRRISEGSIIWPSILRSACTKQLLFGISEVLRRGERWLRETSSALESWSVAANAAIALIARTGAPPLLRELGGFLKYAGPSMEWRIDQATMDEFYAALVDQGMYGDAQELLRFKALPVPKTEVLMELSNALVARIELNRGNARRLARYQPRRVALLDLLEARKKEDPQAIDAMRIALEKAGKDNREETTSRSSMELERLITETLTNDRRAGLALLDYSAKIGAISDFAELASLRTAIGSTHTWSGHERKRLGKALDAALQQIQDPRLMALWACQRQATPLESSDEDMDHLLRVLRRLMSPRGQPSPMDFDLAYRVARALVSTAIATRDRARLPGVIKKIIEVMGTKRCRKALSPLLQKRRDELGHVVSELLV